MCMVLFWGRNIILGVWLGSFPADTWTAADSSGLNLGAILMAATPSGASAAW